MKTKTARRALLMSILSLFVCVSMFVGTTFAWFTDSAASARNTITSGNLDVVLEYWNGSAYAEVSTSTKIFDDATLWEPGHTEVAYLKVSNAGSLALKYKLTVGVYSETLGKTKTGADIKLSDHLQFKVVESDTDLVGTYDRETAKNANATATKLQTYNGEYKALEENGDFDYIALIIYMPETVGNEANHDGANKPSIAMGVDLFATQYTYEEDSFDNQYDADAPAIKVATAAELQAVLNAGGNAVLTANITADGNKRFDVPAGKQAMIDLNGYTLTSKDGGGSNTMAIYIDKGAQLTLNDSVGTGKVVSSCYGVYVKQNATFVMNGGTLEVSGNGVYDMGVTVWNSTFIMNGGTINSKFGVWASNYYRDVAGETGLDTCTVEIADGCVLNSTGYADVEYIDALDAVIDVPQTLKLYPTTVYSAAELQTAVDNVANGEYIVLGANITGDVTVTQKADVNFTILGNGKTYAGVITVDGKSQRYPGAGLTIENVNFAADTLSADAFIRLGHVDAARYTNNVTVKDCTFSSTGETIVAVKSYTGGDWNVTLDNLTVNAGMHSLAQLKNVEQGLKVVDCKVYSKNGLNTNNSYSLNMSGCTFDVKGYAVRFGSDAAVYDRNFTITNSTLKSACAETGDAVIEFRKGGATCNLTLTNTTLDGTTLYAGNTANTNIVIN